MKKLYFCFFIIFLSFNYIFASDKSIKLTKREIAWLKEHPVITVVQDSGWPPIEFKNDKGEYVGITSDYLKIIEARLDIKFKRIETQSWAEAYSKLQSWDIDMTTSVTTTPERLKFWAFTKPYMKIPIVIIAHSDVTFISSLKQLSGKKIAVVEGYAVSEWIPRDYPEIELVKVKNVIKGLDLLKKKEVFGFHLSFQC